MLDTMFEMIALAWQANLTRVATFMMAKEVSMRTYNQIGVSDAFHPLSHHQNDPAKLEKLAKIQTYHTEAFARFVKRLATTPDGDGSLLDHSIILYGSNMSNSDLHNNDPLPSAVLGHGYGKIKGGQHLHYPQDTPHANLLLTLLDSRAASRWTSTATAPACSRRSDDASSMARARPDRHSARCRCALGAVASAATALGWAR